MPVKRRVSKRGKLVLTDRAKKIWRSGKGKELVVLIPSGDGMVCSAELAAKFGVFPLFMMLKLDELVAALSQTKIERPTIAKFN